MKLFGKYRIIERNDGKFVAQVRDGRSWYSIDRSWYSKWTGDKYVDDYCLHASMHEAEDCLIEYKRRQEIRHNKKASEIIRVFWR